jgi:uncharacterized membrane protein
MRKALMVQLICISVLMLVCLLPANGTNNVEATNGITASGTVEGIQTNGGATNYLATGTIHDAVDSANTGDKIRLLSKIYTEHDILIEGVGKVVNSYEFYLIFVNN